MAKINQGERNIKRRAVLKLTASGIAIAAAGQAAGAPDDDTVLPEMAKERVATRSGTDQESLLIVDESVATYQTLSEEFYDATVLDVTTDEVYTVRIDESGQEVDRKAVRKQARDAHCNEYGAISVSLIDQIEAASPDEQIDIAIWTDGPDRKAARESIDYSAAPTAPETQTALSEELHRRIGQQTADLADVASSIDGLTVHEVHRGVPVVDAVATPSAIEAVESLERVERVAERTTETEPQLDRAKYDHDYSNSRGGPAYDASEYAVGIYARDWDGSREECEEYLNWAGHKGPDGPMDSHAGQVAMAAASNDEEMPGIATGAKVYTATSTEDSISQEDVIDYLGANAPVVNCSWGKIPVLTK